MNASEICQFLEQRCPAMTPQDVGRAVYTITRQGEAEGIEITSENVLNLFERSNVELARMLEVRQAVTEEAKAVLGRFCDCPESVLKSELAGSYLRTIRASVQSTII